MLIDIYQQEIAMFNRFTNNQETPFNNVDYAMFAAGDADRCSFYGSYHWVFAGSDITARDIINAALEAGFEDAIYPIIEDEFDPANIVNTAGVWDDIDAVAWLWDNVFAPNGWTSVTLSDGAVVFDASLIKLNA